MLRRILFLFTACLWIVGSVIACSDIAPPTTTPVADSKLETPTQASSLATRPARSNGFQTIALAELPKQARETLQLIARGGPFPYRQDGQIFQNREAILPKKERSYYHEYTVETPGSEDRGARRIITGNQGEFYYTDDHYASFKWIMTHE